MHGLLDMKWSRTSLGSDSKESTCHAGDLGTIPRSGRSPGEGNGYPLQYSCLENSMDRGAWRATVHRVTKSRRQLSDLAHTAQGLPDQLKRRPGAQSWGIPISVHTVHTETPSSFKLAKLWIQLFGILPQGFPFIFCVKILGVLGLFSEPAFAVLIGTRLGDLPDLHPCWPHFQWDGQKMTNDVSSWLLWCWAEGIISISNSIFSSKIKGLAWRVAKIEVQRHPLANAGDTRGTG